MITKFKNITKYTLGKLGYLKSSPVDNFHSNHYLCHTARRLEHLASLGIPVSGKSVLEVGAGIGDHSSYYIERGCDITITEVRKDNLSCLKDRFPDHKVAYLDMESPKEVEGNPFDVVHCYGLLYHLSNPMQALDFLSLNTKEILFLETCVSFGENEDINIVNEAQENPTQANSGTGCRPTRSWLYKELCKSFEHVYIPKTQPWHEQFPLDWNSPDKHKAKLKRALYIASREPLQNQALSSSLISHQKRHD